MFPPKYISIEIHYTDGSFDTVPLQNNREMEDFKSPPYARKVSLVRNLAGRWATGHLNLFTFEPKDRPIEQIVFADSGAGYSPVLLGVTLECEGATQEAADIQTIRFGANDVCAATRYTPDTGQGWLETDQVRDAEDRVLLKGENLYQMDLPEGTYEASFELQSESPGGASIDLSIGGELRLDNVEIAAGYPDRFSLPAATEDGHLLLGVRVNGMLGDFEEVALRTISVAPASEGKVYLKPPEREEGLCFGWDDISSLADGHYRNGGIICPDIEARKVFTVHLPDGRYEVELDMITWYPGHPIHVNIDIQGKCVEESLHLEEATCKHEVEITDGRLQIAIETNRENTHSRAPRWEIRALRARPLT